MVPIAAATLFFRQRTRPHDLWTQGSDDCLPGVRSTAFCTRPFV